MFGNVGTSTNVESIFHSNTDKNIIIWTIWGNIVLLLGFFDMQKNIISFCLDYYSILWAALKDNCGSRL